MKGWVKVCLGAVGLLLAAGLVFGLRFYHGVQNPETLFESAPTPAPAQSQAPTAAPQSPAPEAAPAEAAPTPTPTPGAEEALSAQADMDFMQNRVNILALGIDESAERAHWGSYRTDTMLLVSVDFETERVTLLSIPRDSYVKIYNEKGEIADPQEPMAKINNAFSMGGGAQRKGFGYARVTVEKLLDVPVSHYVCVNMPVVKQIVDAMGGVEYDMDIDFTMNGRSYTKGLQHMDGQAVLDYCRMRKDSSDLVRVERQQRMLAKMLETMRESGRIRDIPAMYAALSDNIATDLSLAQISALALMALRFDMDKLETATIPVKAMMIGERSCVGVRTEALARLVRDVFGKKNVHIDPEIDAARLAALPALVSADERFMLPDGSIDYYEVDGHYFVRLPGTNDYVGMDDRELEALLGRGAP